MGVKSQTRFAKVMHAGMTDLAAYGRDLVDTGPVPQSGTAKVIDRTYLLDAEVTSRIKSQAGFAWVVNAEGGLGRGPSRSVTGLKSIYED